MGARAPSADEQAQIDDALALLRSADPGLKGASAYHVLDDPHPEAAARGDAVVLTRGLLDTDGLAAVLAHELGHTSSFDARLTEALDRLVLWEDPLAPPEDPDEPHDGGFLLAIARFTLRLTGGGFAQRLLAPAWAAHWRAREYAADAYASSLGQAEDLARHLFEQLLPFDAPQRRLLFNRAEHPPGRPPHRAPACRARRDRARRRSRLAVDARGGAMKKITPGRCSRSTLHSEAGEAELKLSAEGNWQLRIRRADEREWRVACSGDLAVGGAPSVQGEPHPDPIRLGNLIVDAAARQVTVGSEELALRVKEFDLLATLAAEPNRVFSKAELLRLVFGYEATIRTRTLESHASRLRVKLRNAAARSIAGRR